MGRIQIGDMFLMRISKTENQHLSGLFFSVLCFLSSLVRLSFAHAKKEKKNGRCLQHSKSNFIS
jgi:hypothetical protein